MSPGTMTSSSLYCTSYERKRKIIVFLNIKGCLYSDFLRSSSDKDDTIFCFVFFLIYSAIVLLSTLYIIQLYLRFGRLPFWLSRVGKRLPNTTVVHIYFLFHDIFPQSPTFFSSANHRSILGEKKKT